MNVQPFLGRMDWAVSEGAPSAMTWPGRDESMTLAYNVESARQVNLFSVADWAEGIVLVADDYTHRRWGWGGHFALRDWTRMSYKVLTFTPKLMTALEEWGVRAPDHFFNEF